MLSSVDAADGGDGRAVRYIRREGVLALVSSGGGVRWCLERGGGTENVEGLEVQTEAADICVIESCFHISPMQEAFTFDKQWP